MTTTIGVITELPDLRGIAELVRFRLRTFKSGPLKDAGNPFREMTADDEAITYNLYDLGLRELQLLRLHVHLRDNVDEGIAQVLVLLGQALDVSIALGDTEGLLFLQSQLLFELFFREQQVPAEVEAVEGAAPAGEEDGKVKTVVRDQPKVGRNEPCPCGSGKKYKKCHGING